MIKDDTLMWVGCAVAVVIYIFILFGCAQPEPPAPIAAYRAEYGFTP